MSGSIRLSEKHGVNPSVEQCFFCLKDKGLILFGRLPGDREAPRQTVLNHEPCDECRGWMKQGVICISVRDGEPEENPYRTGGWVVLRDDAIRRLFGGAAAESALRARVCFIEDRAWDAAGLPRGPLPAEPPTS